LFQPDKNDGNAKPEFYRQLTQEMSALFQSEYDFEIGKRLDEAIVELLGEGSSEKFANSPS